MQIIKTYIAEDGTKFDNEWECAEHEEKLTAQKFADTAFIYDKDGNPLPMVASGFETAVYLVAKTDEAAAFMAELFKDWCNPWWNSCEAVAAGCWVSPDGDEWQPAEDILKMARIIEQIS